MTELEKTEKITINLGLVDLGQIDLLVQEGFYTNRTARVDAGVQGAPATRCLCRAHRSGRSPWPFLPTCTSVRAGACPSSQMLGRWQHCCQGHSRRVPAHRLPRT